VILPRLTRLRYLKLITQIIQNSLGQTFLSVGKFTIYQLLFETLGLNCNKKALRPRFLWPFLKSLVNRKCTDAWAEAICWKHRELGESYQIFLQWSTSSSYGLLQTWNTVHMMKRIEWSHHAHCMLQKKVRCSILLIVWSLLVASPYCQNYKYKFKWALIRRLN
jgi:hypothetical protein